MGLVVVDEQGRTSVAGVYTAGDMTTLARTVVFAVAQGAMAAVTINMELVAEDF